VHIIDYCISLSLSLSVADFGVAAEISASVAKRKSFIGTPYWWAVGEESLQNYTLNFLVLLLSLMNATVYLFI